MKIFLSYKWTNIPVEEIHALIDPIYNYLKENHEVYCNLYDPLAYILENKEIMTNALEILNECNFQLIIHDDVGKKMGEGGLIEIGAAFNKMPQLLLYKKGAKTRTSKALVTQSIMYNTHEELLDIVKNYKFVPIKCKINLLDKYKNPIDPVTKKSISKNKIYMLNSRCYDKDSIRKILTESEFDPMSGRKVSKNVFKDLNIKK